MGVRTKMWLHRVRKLRRLSAEEWRDLLRAQLMLFRVQFLVWLRPTGKLVSVVDADRTGGGAPVVLTPSQRARARRIGYAVERAAYHGPIRPLCLVRAVSISELLRRERIEGGRVRVGVAAPSGRFEAHAWVELDGMVLGDSEDRVARNFLDLAEINLR